MEVLYRIAVARLRQQEISGAAAYLPSADIAIYMDDRAFEVAKIMDYHFAIGRKELGNAQRNLLKQGEGRFSFRQFNGRNCAHWDIDFLRNIGSRPVPAR